MKFRIRFAEQIVGAFIILALLSLVALVFFLGSKQRWFAKDYHYVTYFDSAAGLSANMSVLYKGFTIGRINSFILTDDDEVEVTFSIYDKYVNRVREGSLVQLNVSPIGLGNQFIFYPGTGQALIDERSHIPAVDSPKGQTLIQLGLAQPPERNDSISNLFTQVSKILEDTDAVLVQVRNAFAGTGSTTLGRALGEAEGTIAGVNHLMAEVNASLGPILASASQILTSANQMAANLNAFSEELTASDGFLATVLDADGSIYASLESSLKSVSRMLENLDKTSALLPVQGAGIFMELRTALKTAEDVLVSLTNNPLLKGGIPSPVKTESGGINSRDISF
jgi:phospholipid/cholesterol/gamma-HCH transport system substrate-binding protein